MIFTDLVTISVLPQTIRALLVTDVVDSTRLAAELGDVKVAELWAAHDRVARDLLARHDGREIDKTDGFLLLFEEARDAVEYALAYHAALSDLQLEARAGLHVGDVVLRENTPEDIARGAKPLEVDGIAKPVAARVMSIAEGGQTLATTQAVKALDISTVKCEPDGRVEGEGLLAVTHGHWMLKGVRHPQELFEIGVQGEAPFTPPPDAAKAWRVHWQNGAWVPVRQVKHSLPAERDAFVGRDEDLAELAQRLDDGARLVSVLGIGGTGKTRLVTHFGWTWLGSFPGGVWFCDLSEARSADGIAYAVATALDVPLGKEPFAQLGHAIAGRGRCLVILDNFEQVARHAPETLGRWLDRAAEAQYVVTTREVLGLPGEKSLALAPLPKSDGARLFVERARDAKRDFAPDDTASIEALVQLLDGLPLAIELAAARVRLMPPKTLLSRMSQRFRLLTSSGGRRDRQATLRGALDWSWDLLSGDEQSALAQVSVFEGGFTLEAAAAVLELGELWPEDAVQALLDKSLVRRVSDERFDLLVSVQEYAAERLDGLGQRSAAESRHGAWCAGFGSEEALDSLSVHGGVARRWALAAELDNIVAASRRAVARCDGATAAATLKASWEPLSMRGPYAVAADLATAALALPDLAPPTRFALTIVLGHAMSLSGLGTNALARFNEALAIARDIGDRRSEGHALGDVGIVNRSQGRPDEAQAHYEASLAIAREVGDRRSEGHGLGALGLLHMNQGRPNEARANFEASLAIHREVGNLRSEGVVLTNLGTLDSHQGRTTEARAHYDQALAIHREVGDRRLEGMVLGNLGGLYTQQGRSDEARAHFEEALAIAREVGDRRLVGTALGNLGNLHSDKGGADAALALYEEALAIHREVRNRRGEGIALGNLANLHAGQGRPEEALAQFDEALAVHREVGNRRSEGLVLCNLGVLHVEQGRPDEARAAFDAGEALLRGVGYIDNLGYLLCARARLEHAEGHADVARVALAEAEALAAELGAGEESDLGKEITETRAALRTP